MNKLLPKKLPINTDVHPKLRGPRCSKRPQDALRGPEKPKRQRCPKRPPKGPQKAPRCAGGCKRPQQAPGASEASRGPHEAPGGLVLLVFLSVKYSSSVDTIKLESHFFAMLFLMLVFTSLCVFVCFSGVFSAAPVGARVY